MGGEPRGGFDAAVAFLSGVVVGAVAGVLMAPQAGKETQEQLREQTKEAARRVRETGKAIRDTVTNTADAVRRSIRNEEERMRAEEEPFPHQSQDM